MKKRLVATLGIAVMILSPVSVSAADKFAELTGRNGSAYSQEIVLQEESSKFNWDLTFGKDNRAHVMYSIIKDGKLIKSNSVTYNINGVETGPGKYQIRLDCMGLSAKYCEAKATYKIKGNSVTVEKEQNYLEQNNRLNNLLRLEKKLIDYDIKNQNTKELSYLLATEMTNRIGKIDGRILKKLAESGTIVKLIDYPMTDIPELSNSKGVIPRGWEGTKDVTGKQKTWDDVPGMFSHDDNLVVARIGYSEPGKGHNTINLELHETAHAIDSKVFNDTSHNRNFKEIHRREQNNILPANYFNNTEEYFAECFAYYYFDDASKAKLKEKAPSTYSYIENLINTLR